MKKTPLFTFLFLCLLSPLAWGQNPLNSSMSIRFEYPNNQGNYLAEDQIVLDYTAFNLSNHDILMDGRFELRMGGSVVYETPFDTQTLSYLGGSSSGTLTFTFPEECDLTPDHYDLHLVVYYSHEWTLGPVLTNTFGDFTLYCNDLPIPQSMPGETTSSQDCDLPIFGVTYAPDPICCPSTPTITFSTAPAPGQFGQACSTTITANIDFGKDMIYGIEWNNGSSNPSITHNCEVGNYSVVVTWFENGNICSTSSHSIRVKSPCECPMFSDRLPINPVDKEQHKKARTQLFPNPNNGAFQLEMAAGRELYRYQVFNLLGQQVLDRSTNFQGFSPFIHLPQLASGSYSLRLHFKDQQSENLQFIIR
ncbi:MAG: T9SS type A sorting domain-containing protein [Bacteroidota bacterium]